jgi:glycosyltransferase involved in cell wall biosynthesis
MKVLLVHNRYQTGSPSGEDTVFEAERALLAQNGMDTVCYTRSNDEIGGLGKAAMLFTMEWSKRTYTELRELIGREKPDIAHFHNIFYCVTPSGYDACRDMGVPVVQTLHNYRLLCANGLCLYDGKVCTDCLDKRFGRSIARRCFRHSYAYSVAMARFLHTHTSQGTFTNKIDAFITLTEHQRQIYIQGGFPPEKIYVKPNFIARPIEAPPAEKKAALYIGRLSHEKGIEHLLRAWETVDYPLLIAGDGPLRDRVASAIRDKNLTHIRYLGRVDRAEMAALYAQAAFLVFPSLWYEGMSMVILEALSAGVPVLCADAVAMGPDLTESGCGALYRCGDIASLRQKVVELLASPEKLTEMGERARTMYRERYTPEKNWKLLYTLYTSVLQS